MDPSYREKETTKATNRKWIWYFALLVVLSLVSVSVLIAYNLRQQLKMEDLQNARALWESKGPKNYELEYTKEGIVNGKIVARVHNGKVTFATDDGRPLESWQYPYHTMPALFSFIEKFLEDDSAPHHPRSFTIGRFDPVDGHLLHYVRRVTGTRDRLEITVQLRPLGFGQE